MVEYDEQWFEIVVDGADPPIDQIYFMFEFTLPLTVDSIDVSESSLTVVHTIRFACTYVLVIGTTFSPTDEIRG